jgi:hypothetical protein
MCVSGWGLAEGAVEVGGMAICGCTTMPRVGRAVNGMTSFIQATASCIAIAVPAAVMDVRARACGVRVLKHCAVASHVGASAAMLHSLPGMLRDFEIC